MATYFAIGRKKIIKVTPNRKFSISLIFSNNEKKVYIDTNGNVCRNKDSSVDSERNWNDKLEQQNRLKCRFTVRRQYFK